MPDLQLLRYSLQSREERLDVLKIVASCFSERERPWSSLEQNDTKLLLQCFDLVTDCRWCDKQFLCRDLEAQAVRGYLERPQKLQRR